MILRERATQIVLLALISLLALLPGSRAGEVRQGDR